MADNQKKYDIEVIKIKKKPTGEIDRFGRKVWATVGKPKTDTINTTFADLKVDKYRDAQNNGNVFVDYRNRISVRQRKVISSVTTLNPDGTKIVEYFKKVRKPVK